MLDIKYIREHIDVVKENCKNRNVSVDLDALLELEGERRGIIQKLETLRSQKNKKSKSRPPEEEIKMMKEVGNEIKALGRQLSETDKQFSELMMSVPNLSHPDSPVGGEDDFTVLETSGEKPEFDFEPKDHEELMTNLDMLDLERGAKVAGSKFYYTKGDAVLLNRSLMHYAMDVATKHGYQLMETPDMVKSEILEGSGFNPRGEESQIYEIEGYDLNLIGTAEISVLGYHANEVLDFSKGPVKYAAISHCYRVEAGSYGRTSKGLYRVHQFEKLELFIFCDPKDSEMLHNELLAIEKEICDGLGLRYRVIDIATGDLGGPAYRKYDIEAYMAMKDGYGEITSTSNATDYQARRMNIRYKNGDKNDFVHTLNGTAMVLSRFPIAIVEQYQKRDGSIEVPEVLIGYMGKGTIE
ncbi:MAG: serine--tRNA ligase [Candidatus Magasanikbacteria bacterium]